LELGCGTGVFSGILAKNGRKTTLLDYSEKSVEFCRTVFAAANLDGHFVQADVFKPFPFEDNSFDCVWSSGLLEHYTDEEILFVLKESARVSRKQVISLVPNARSMFYRLGKWYQETHGLWPFGREDPKRSMKRLFSGAGMTVQSEFTIDVRGAIYFLNPLRPTLVRWFIKLIARTLPMACWNVLNQGFLLVTIGSKSVATDVPK
jgi:SAM-dependent methyltransferase